MKEALLLIKRFLEKNGLIKIVVAFVVLIISVLILKTSLSDSPFGFFTLTGYISLMYILVAGGVYFIVGIINTLKDLFRK